MGYTYWSYDTLKKLCNDVFDRIGFTGEETDTITDVLLTSDRYGIESHGVQRLLRYHNAIKRGAIDPKEHAEIVFETPVSAVLDGKGGMGQVTSYKAMRLAIEKAKKSGIAVVSVRNSNHFGIAGYYAKMACKEGLIGFACTNSEPCVPPTFGKTAMLGTNPIAISMPAEPYDFFFDSATSVVTKGKLELSNKRGVPLHDGWAVDENGVPTNDAYVVLGNMAGRKGGGILPLGGSEEYSGGHKGYGYSMICEIFSSILSLGVTSQYTGQYGHVGICHGFAAINPEIFGDPAAIKDHLSKFLEELRESPKADGHERIYTHGEKEVEAVKRSEEQGIPVNDNTILEFSQVCSDLGLNFSDYFGDYKLPESEFKGNFY